MVWNKQKAWLLALILLLGAALYLFKFAGYYPRRTDLNYKAGYFGATFSTQFCDELQLDWKETYAAMLDELQIKNIRIPVYWDEIEKTEGVYDFSKYDYLIDEGSRRGARFIISIGRRVPRWPECHGPAWLDSKDGQAAQAATLDMIRQVVERYRGRDSVEYWQVENEPFLGTFGICPPLDESFLRQEFDLVRSLDKRQVIITGSGEMSSWREEGKIGDIFGSTLYRVVYNSWFGYVRFPMPEMYYKLKAKFAGLPAERLMILELQTEPWVPKGQMIALTDGEIDKSMSIGQFKSNLQYAIDLNFGRAYVWGVEWWYWQKKHGNPEYWRIATSLFK